MADNIFTDFAGWKKAFKENWKWIVFSLVLLFLALKINEFAGAYVDSVAGKQPASDILLDNIPTFQLSFIFVWGFLLLNVVAFFYTLLFSVKESSKLFFMWALFIVVRSIFISMTHLELSPDAADKLFPSFLGDFYFSNDMFFSGHAGTSFLIALVLKNKIAKGFFFVSSIFMSVVVLMMHLHYSIDVAAAYFITYGIYKIGDNAYNALTNKETK